MAQDWASDVKKFAPDADDGVIAGIVRYCGIALQKPDSAMVSFSDPVELSRVRNNFLKKKLALTESDDVLDAAIARVGERMKGDNSKNRVTVYYLLLEDLGLTHLFAKKGTAAAIAGAGVGPGTGAVAAAAAGTATAVASPATQAAPKKAATPRKAKVAPVTADTDTAIAGATTTATTVASTDAASVAAIAPVAALAMVSSEPAATTTDAATTHAMVGSHSALPRSGIMPSFAGPGVTPHRFSGGSDDGKPVLGWLWLCLAGIAVMALFVFLPRGERPSAAAAAPAPADAPDPAGIGTAAAPATAATAVPDGAGIVSETRDAKPVVKVYFDTGKAVVAPTFGIAAEPLKTWLAANAGSRIGVSGYNDPSGNAAANAALSKRRAQAVQAALVSAGIAAGSIDLVKPEAATDGKTTAAEARRVEAFIK